MHKALIFTVAVLGLLVAGIAGVTASKSDDVVHSIKEPVVIDKSLPEAPQAPKPVEVLKPMGEPSPVVKESTTVLTNQSPLGLIEGIFLARTRDDKAWLARTLESTSGKSEITEDDCNAAWRNYLWVPELWDRMEAAHRKSPAVIEEQGDVARVSFDVGGNAGVLYVQFKKINGAWYLLGA